MEKDLPELVRITDIVSCSALTAKFIDTHGRPLITDGEVYPTDIVPVIAPNSKGIRSAFPMQWGFLARDNKRTLFNARVETAGTKPTFREAWRSHRCIIPASCYYEWQHFKTPDGREKKGDKYLIQPAGSTVTWLGGLYSIENGYPVFVILTREPTAELSRIHDRMPLILPEERIDDWIDPDSNPEEILRYALTDMIMEKADHITTAYGLAHS
ncbi:MAG: SOS response-associated peptidase [Lachnospiraceae bacterium]|nr:SOS response-associated peptidase [Lachnospiraceae bacterium]